MTKRKVIVPLHGRPVAAPGAPAAHLRYGNGHLITAVQVFTAFWGSDWKLPANSGLIGHVNEFFDAIVTSSLFDMLAEYSVPGQTIGHGSRIGSTTVTATEPGGDTKRIADAQIQTALQDWIRNGTVPPVNSNTLYFVYLPPGVTAVDPSNGSSCQQLCGYHWFIAANPEVYYAVMPFPDCGGCLGGLSQIEALTSISSHELCEGVTDPHPWTGWNDDSYGEIGDICAWQTDTVSGYLVQKEWSNAANACVTRPPAIQDPLIGKAKSSTAHDAASNR